MLNFDGFYTSLSWFVTGESRPYDHQAGCFARVIPKRNFDWGRGGWGAWELAAFYLEKPAPVTAPGQFRVLEAGPVRATIEVRQKLGTGPRDVALRVVRLQVTDGPKTLVVYPQGPSRGRRHGEDDAP